MHLYSFIFLYMCMIGLVYAEVRRQPRGLISLLQLYGFQAPISGPKARLYLLSRLSLLSGENRPQVHAIPFNTICMAEAQCPEENVPQ